MTLHQLAADYHRSADLLRRRIRRLERERACSADPALRRQLDRRLYPLHSMYRQTRSTARHLEGLCRRPG